MKRERKVKTIGCKVTLEQFRIVTEAAHQCKQTAGEWVREVLLESIKTRQADLNTQLLLAELAAIRGSMLLLLQHVINGTTITDQELMVIVDDADQARFQIAASRLREGMKVLAFAAKKEIAE